MFGVYDLLKKGYFPKGSKVLAIHTGGLQGIVGMNYLLMKKNMPLID
jgi:1-aminocyclopropane-1-carboxylate deaminase